MQKLMDANPTYALIFQLVILIWVISETPVVIRGLVSRTARRHSGHDRGSLIVVALALTAGGILGTQLSIHIPGAAISWQRPLVFFLGVALMLLGVTLGLWSILTLGRFFTPSVSVRTGQRVVERGPTALFGTPHAAGCC